MEGSSLSGVMVIREENGDRWLNFGLMSSLEEWAGARSSSRSTHIAVDTATPGRS